MLMQMVAIRDTKAAAWMNPLFFQTKAQAIRAFGDAVNDPQGEFQKHPEDYQLYHVGTFNPETGDVIGTPPEVLGIGTNYLHLIEA